MKIQNWIEKSTKILKNSNTPYLDSQIILCYVLKKNLYELIFNNDYYLTSFQLKSLKKILKRRYKMEPIAYITKKKEFWSLNFTISKNVLIPRPDTEVLIEKTLKLIGHKKYKILDVGTGSGNIAISIAKSKKICTVIGVDISKTAITLANYNAKKLKIKNVKFFVSDLFSSINAKYNIIVSNPPYVSQKEFLKLSKDVHFEPKIALLAKKNGTFFIEKIILEAKQYLHKNGWLILEHSHKQKELLINLLKMNNFYKINSFKDYGGNFRVTIGNIQSI